MNKKLGDNEKSYVKCISGTTIEDMVDYARPTVRKQPDLIVLHAGTNELVTKKTASNIASDIIKLALQLKTGFNDLWVVAFYVETMTYTKKVSKLI